LEFWQGEDGDVSGDLRGEAEDCGLNCALQGRGDEEADGWLGGETGGEGEALLFAEFGQVWIPEMVLFVHVVVGLRGSLLDASLCRCEYALDRGERE